MLVSYLRGLRYKGECTPQGGDRRSEEARARGGAIAGAALAEEFGVTLRTIQRDGEFAAAVNKIAAHCGEEVKTLLLGKKPRLGREAILELAGLPTKKQQEIVLTWELEEKVTQEWRQGNGDGKPATITLPREPGALARALLEREGTNYFGSVLQAMQDVVATRQPESAEEGCRLPQEE